MKAKIRYNIMWHLIRVYNVCLQDFPSKIEKQKYRPDTPKMTNRLIRHITVEESTSIYWVKSTPPPPHTHTHIHNHTLGEGLHLTRLANIISHLIMVASILLVNINFPQKLKVSPFPPKLLHLQYKVFESTKQ